MKHKKKRHISIRGTFARSLCGRPFAHGGYEVALQTLLDKKVIALSDNMCKTCHRIVNCESEEERKNLYSMAYTCSGTTTTSYSGTWFNVSTSASNFMSIVV